LDKMTRILNEAIMETAGEKIANDVDEILHSSNSVGASSHRVALTIFSTMAVNIMIQFSPEVRNSIVRAMLCALEDAEKTAKEYDEQGEAELKAGKDAAEVLSEFAAPSRKVERKLKAVYDTKKGDQDE
jgi:aspartate-semialdehyde dehydrogenase